MKCIFKITFVLFAVVVLFACKKDYYVEGGLARQSDAEKNMLAYDFLKSRTGRFDSLVKIIDLTNMKNIVNQEDVTFFANTNSAVLRFQVDMAGNTKLPPRALAKIGVDTLKNLLSRFIIPNNKIMLEDVPVGTRKPFKSFNNEDLALRDTLLGFNNIPKVGAAQMYYTHFKTPVDVAGYDISVQTHNLITKNAIIHVLLETSNFGSGFKIR